MSFNPLLNPVDHIVLSGQKSPGIAVLSGSGLERLIDERKGFGSIGATTIVRGRKLARFTVEFKLAEADDFAAWPDFAALLKRNPRSSETGGRSAKVNPYSIQHPILEDLEITAVVLAKLHQPKPTTEDGEWTYAVDFVEYRRRRLGLASTGDETNGAEVDPFDREIARLSGQVERLAGPP